MFHELDEVLTADELARLAAIAAASRFVDGRISNPHSEVKNNLQMDPAEARTEEASKLMAQALFRIEDFRNFAFPRVMAPPILARYSPGMRYGAHSDAAFLPVGARPLRSDLSCTLFIAAPESYEGGELSIHLGARTVDFKGKPGSAVVYPSNTLHEVKPVTGGERLVGLTFIESMIPDGAHRELLYELNEVAALEGFNMSADNRTRLEYVRNALRRMWGEAG
ncbi:MAG TPA: Fe2+-dependent dioxygenase [Caulobacteraceae bacterium]|nr:Fe2+-dependent dioxygenase [Caulobacteraceae bacterium]